MVGFISLTSPCVNELWPKCRGELLKRRTFYLKTLIRLTRSRFWRTLKAANYGSLALQSSDESKFRWTLAKTLRRTLERMNFEFVNLKTFTGSKFYLDAKTDSRKDELLDSNSPMLSKRSLEELLFHLLPTTRNYEIKIINKVF